MTARDKTIFGQWQDLGAAVITGGSSGLGETFAENLAQIGFDIVLSARREQKLREIAQRLEETYGIKTEIVLKDLSIDTQVDELADTLKKRNDVDVLVNNAGFGSSGHFTEENFEARLNMMKVHMWAPVKRMHAVLPKMKKRKRGAIINTASLASFLPAKGASMYSSTKAFLRVFSESLHYEVKEHNIRIQALCPGFVHTEFHKTADLTDLKKSTSKLLWMDAQKVIDKSLRALKKDKVVVVPGLINKIGQYLMTSNWVGKYVRNILQVN